MQTLNALVTNGFVTHLLAGLAGWAIAVWNASRTANQSLITQLQADIAAVKAANAPKTTTTPVATATPTA